MLQEALIEVDNVSKKFCLDLKKSLWYGVKDIVGEVTGRGNSEVDLRSGEFWSVKDLSFELRRGECLGLIGPNGAGKSTLLKMINGLIKPDRGRIAIRGRVGALIELGAGFNPILTGRENVYVNGAVLGFSKEEIDRKFDDIVEFAELDDFIDMPVQNYSSGMKVRLGFAVAAQMDPDVLIIDEVLAVGDIGFRIKCLNRISELISKCAVIFVSHAMPQVLRICTQALLMRKGGCVISAPAVSKVIDHYYQEFGCGEQNMTISNGFEIKNISINGKTSKENVIVAFGGELNVRFDYYVTAKCQKFLIKMAIWNQDQRPVLDVLTEDFQIFTWNNEPQKTSLSANVPSLRLSGGKYSIVIWVADQESMEILCRFENALTFTMSSSVQTDCDILHPAKWSG